MLAKYDYAVVRIVPRVERGEFLNVGVLVSSERDERLLLAFELDEARLLSLAPDVDLALVRRHMTAFERVVAGGPENGPIGALPLRARFHWLTAVRSALVQTSPVHAGMTTDLDATLARLVRGLVRPLPPTGPPEP